MEPTLTVIQCGATGTLYLVPVTVAGRSSCLRPMATSLYFRAARDWRGTAYLDRFECVSSGLSALRSRQLASGSNFLARWLKLCGFLADESSGTEQAAHRARFARDLQDVSIGTVPPLPQFSGAHHGR
jgi:hypothetical protein